MTGRRGLVPVILVVLGVAGGSLYLADQLRPRHVLAREEMVWECTNHSPLHPGPIVLLRFLNAPEYFGFRDDPTGSFCRFVGQNGLPTVWVVSDVYGSKRSGLRSWTEETLDGRPIPLGFSGGDGTLGQPTHTFPYEADFEAAFHHRGFSLLR